MQLEFEKPQYSIIKEQGLLLVTPSLPSYVRIRLTEVFGEQCINIESDGAATLIETAHLEPIKQQDLLADLTFFSYHPTIPVENLCSRLNNYYPGNQIQQEALDWTTRLIDFGGSQAAGLYIWGSPGVGKTHLAVGAAKELMMRGKNTHFIGTHNSTRYDSLLYFMKNDGTRINFDQDYWIIDDLNSPYGTTVKVWRELVLLLHDQPSKIIVTGNINYEELVKGALLSQSEEKDRFVDRIKTMFKIINMQGYSQRPDSAWFHPTLLGGGV